ncbi:MAG: hypothetical protein GX050_02465 [Firmicutes bacterium]|nr:hypothetical protein [Bacillota bacterium]
MKTYTIKQGKDFIKYYTFKSDTENKENLIIYIDGSGYTSVLGLKKQGSWKAVTMAYELQSRLLPRFDLLVPEKKNMNPGKNYENQIKIIEDYSLEQRVQTAKTAITDYLEGNTYKRVLLVGHSEGGYILPRLYLSLKDDFDISGLAILSVGGLSQYEMFKTLKDKDLPYPAGYKQGLDWIEEAARDIKKNPESITKKYLGHPYKRWSSFMFYRPVDELVQINIPILMIHGSEDMMSPVESSRFVKNEFENLGKNNLYYIEYVGKGHDLGEDFDRVVCDIEKWFNEMIQK